MSEFENLEINGEMKEVIAYSCMYEYVEDGDFTYYAQTQAYEGEFIVLPARPFDDPDFFIVGEPVILNDGNTYLPVNFGEVDDRIHVVDVERVYDEVYLIYVWNDGEYVAFNGVAYPSEEAAMEKTKELQEDE